MCFNQIKSLFRDAIFQTISHFSPYIKDPDKDFSRRRKLPPELLISFLVSQGAASSKNELIDFFDFQISSPSLSALNQQRDKLKPQAIENVFHLLNRSLSFMEKRSGYRLLAADGSSFSFFSNPKWTPSDFFVSDGHSAKGFYCLHLNALYDLDTHTYLDAYTQPVHCKDEFKAFCIMADRTITPKGMHDIFIADRGYCSYNNMAHVIEKNQFFLFRSKDVSVRGAAAHLPVPKQGEFDLSLTITITRSSLKKVSASGDFVTYIGAASSFDFIPYGSFDTYSFPLRIIRFQLDNGSYECIMTNLTADHFSTQAIKHIYFRRWGIETSFRKLKYTISLTSFHSYKVDFILQELWAKLIAYNLTETIIRHVVLLNVKKQKYLYKVNFSVAAHICRVFLRFYSNRKTLDVMALISKYLIPVRNGRNFPRLQTAHFRRPKYFLYRAA